VPENELLIPRRLAVLVTNDLSGDSRVLKTCHSGSTNGYTVAAFTTMPANVEDIQNEDSYLIVRCGDVPQKRKYPRPSPAALLRRGLEFIHIDARRLVARALKIRVRGLANAFRPALIDFRPDIIHANDPDTLTLAMTYKQQADYPVAVVYDSHEYVRGVNRPSKGWNDFMLREEATWISSIDGCIAVSPLIADLLAIDYSLDSLPAVIVNYPTSSDKTPVNKLSTIRNVLELSSDTPLHVYVGASAVARGIETAIRALVQLPGHHLALVTKHNPYVAAMEKLATEISVADRFHILPYVPANYVATFISDATAGLSPLKHHKNHELACPTKIYEYLHANLPITSSDLMESTRFINEHTIGEIFTADDIDDCARAMNQVVIHRDRYVSNITSDLKLSTIWESQNSTLKETYDTAYINAVSQFQT
jgi:glycosyltransferase involved in cell wall biosynthesis